MERSKFDTGEQGPETQFVPQITEKGFLWGPAEIERIQTDDESGSVTLGLKTIDIDLEIVVTGAGMVRIYVPSGGMVMVEAQR